MTYVYYIQVNQLPLKRDYKIITVHLTVRTTYSIIILFPLPVISIKYGTSVNVLRLTPTV